MKNNTIYKCPLCEKKYNKINSLRIHWSKKHKKNSKELYIKLFCNNIEPVCACGCGEKVKYLNITLGFSQYKLGHIARINNNWGHNKKILLKSQKTRREKYKNGEIQIWNKGLTKETSNSVKQYGINGSKTVKNNKKEIKTRSIRMRKNRLNGTVPTLYGSEHSQWKGGVSTIRALLKTNTKLYYEWKLPNLQKANFSCEKCNNKNNLHVHHNKETMSSILRKIAKKYNIEDYINKPSNNCKNFTTLKEKLINEIVNYHINNNVSGIVLCEKCHKKEHKNLNF